MHFPPTTGKPGHALSIDPASPHAFKAPPDEWALIATTGTDAGTGVYHVRVAQPRQGHPPRCRVLGCARPVDDPIHDDR